MVEDRRTGFEGGGSETGVVVIGVEILVLVSRGQRVGGLGRLIRAAFSRRVARR